MTRSSRLSPQRRSARVLTCVVALCCLVGSASNVEAKKTLVVPDESRQLIVGITNGWDDQHVTLRRFTREKARKNSTKKEGGAQPSLWKQEGESWVGRVGKQGLAWGRGLHPHEPIPAGVTDKVEGDQKAPAGVFDLGMIFGYAANVERNPNTEYVQVTDHDLLVYDPTSPLYNSYVHLDHAASTAWEIANQMNLNDPAHELKVFVRHNKDPKPVPGKGSAILLHIQRPNENSFTVGCTAMPRDRMFEVVKWLDASARPLYVLLPQQTYDPVAASWGLPRVLVTTPAATTTSAATTTKPSISKPSTTIPAATNTIPVATQPPKRKGKK